MSSRLVSRMKTVNRGIRIALPALLATVGLATSASAGLVTTDLTTGATPNSLVQSMLGTGVPFSNVVYKGAAVAAGTFSTSPPDPTIIGFAKGIVLSSGCVKNVVGPNTTSSATCTNYRGGDADLATLNPGYGLYDAATIEFDFVPKTNTVSFQYVWSSEEYNEYANTSYNDVFGFFLNHQNVAFIPGTHTPVSINNINGGNPYGYNSHHPEYFRNNEIVNAFGAFVGGPINTQMDGLTVVFTAKGTVTPNQTNHIKLGVADAGDMILDSDVFIKASSFTDVCPCGGQPINGICPLCDPPVNPAPVAVCKAQVVYADSNCQGTAKVNGGSYDPDGEAINCVQSPTGPFALGQTSVTLTCTDAHGSSSCTTTVTVVDKTPPAIVCPDNQTDECVDNGAFACFPPAAATDNCGAVTTSCTAAACSFFGLGNDGVTCTATDKAGNASSCGFNVNVVDTQPPVVTPNQDGNGVSGYLWPPNHKYWEITMADCIGAATDQCVGNLPLDQFAAFVKVYSDEVEETGHGGDGHTCNDMVFTNNGTVQLRAERQGGNTHSGRVYHIAYAVNDGHGNVTPGTCVIDVSHDQSGNTTPAIDSCAPGGPGPNCDPVAPRAGAFCVPGPGQSPAVCKGYGALHDPNCNW